MTQAHGEHLAFALPDAQWPLPNWLTTLLPVLITAILLLFGLLVLALIWAGRKWPDVDVQRPAGPHLKTEKRCKHRRCGRRRRSGTKGRRRRP